MDILTIGEVLIDLTQTGKDARGIPQFAANPGGAPANLAVAASRLGAQTAFIGKVGADAFGRYLKEVLAENKVDVSGMAVDADHPTTMAVVSVDATGERDFSFYRSANADVMLCKEDISDEALKAAKIVHFGSVSLTADPSIKFHPTSWLTESASAISPIISPIISCGSSYLLVSPSSSVKEKL